MAYGCKGCRDPDHTFDIAMAFQPIIDIDTNGAFAYEALVRGPQGESAASVLDQLTDESKYAFDQQCRISAIKGAVAAGILDSDARLSINFLPNAIYSPLACIQLTLETARKTGFPTDRLIFEFTENEEIVDTDHVRAIVQCYNEMGFGTAIDDFGAGHAGLSLLARMQTDYLKVDMGLTRNIDLSPRSRIIVHGMVDIAAKLGVTVIAEGIETLAEYHTLRSMGVRYFQGYLFAKPAFKTFPQFAIPDQPVALAG